jgi:hypothetical protein
VDLVMIDGLFGVVIDLIVLYASTSMTMAYSSQFK